MNDGGKPNRKTILQKGGKKGMSYYFKSLPEEDTSLLAEQKDAAKKVRKVLLFASL